jgi:regulator of CtrA degradation
MSNVYRVDGAPVGSATTVSFGERFQSSEQFDHIFKEGMALVERTASYLDGPGRKEAKALAGGAGVLYATESMRLTTRLLDLASWLLIRRALREGEITEDEAKKKRRRVKLQAFGRPSHVKGYSELPEGLQNLIEESFALHDRISQLDRILTSPSAAEVPGVALNPVAHQVGLLQRAFAAKVS